MSGGLADVNPGTLQAVGHRYGIATLAADHRELLARGDVEAVLVLASGSHRDGVLASLPAVERSTPLPGSSWWDVPVAEVSESKPVEEARRDYVEALKKRRFHY